jgi:hypothetical protein
VRPGLCAPYGANGEADSWQRAGRRRAIAIDAVGGAEIQAPTREICKTPPALVARVKEIIGDKE